MDSQDRGALLAVLAAQIAAFERADDRTAITAGLGSAGGGVGRPPTAERGAGQSNGARPGSSATDPGLATRPLANDQVAAAKAICLRLLAVAPRPRAGLAQALSRKEIPDDVAEVVLDRLTEVGLIDDVAYAQSFVRTKHRERALGRTALDAELRKLGVDKKLAADASATIDSGAEHERAVELISKRVDAAMAAGPIAARRRLLGLLARRGYPAEIALPVVERALQDYSGSPGGGSGNDG